MSIFTLHSTVLGDYRDFVRSFFSVADDRARDFIDRELVEQARLWPEALLQVSPSYARVASVDELAARGLLLPETAQIFRNERGEPFFLYQHQVEAVELARRNESYVVTSGTGSGKSLTYFLPIVDAFLRRPTAPDHCIAIQPNARLVIGGNLISAGGRKLAPVARLLPDGRLDPGFKAQVVLADSWEPSLYAIAVQPDGKVVLGGRFRGSKKPTGDSLIRLASDGRMDESFRPELDTEDARQIPYCLAVQPDGKLVVGGEIYLPLEKDARTPAAPASPFRPHRYAGVVRLKPDGSWDRDFGSDLQLGGTSATRVRSLAVDPNGKVVIGGSFSRVNQASCNAIARLNADGSLDRAFSQAETADPAKPLNSGVDGPICAMALQTDGKLIVAGEFSSVSGVPMNHVARLNTDGTLDGSFKLDDQIQFLVSGGQQLALQPDGKVIMIGGLRINSGRAGQELVRLKADGSIDSSFRPGVQFAQGEGLGALTIQRDGKVVIGGGFRRLFGFPRQGVLRLRPDGSLDDGFDPGLAIDGGATFVAVQSDGKLLVAGNFNVPDRLAIGFALARLLPDGRLDRTFQVDFREDPPYQSIRRINQVLPLPDGGLLVGGRRVRPPDQARRKPGQVLSRNAVK